MRRIYYALLFLVCLFGCFCMESCTSTPPIKATNGKRAVGGIAEITTIDLNNFPPWLLIRGTNTINNPLLLWLHGGPGASGTALFRKYNQELEQHFTVVYWDQRGAGKSYSKDLPANSIRVNKYMEDTYKLVQYLKKRFSKDKVLLIGHSWGSRLGMYMINKYLEDFIAFVGIGQEVAHFEGETQSYQFTLQRAQQTGNGKALKDLQESGPPQTANPELYKNGFWGHVNQKNGC